MKSRNEASRTDERALIEDARRGDQAAFETLAKNYSRVLDWHIRSLSRSCGLHEDLFQEGMIGLLKAVRSYEPDSSAFATYASLCIRRSIISAIRKYSNHNHRLVFFDEAPPEELGADSAESEFIDRESTGILYDKVFEALSPYEKRVFEMYLSDMSYIDMACVLGRDVKSVGNAVGRIRRKLRKVVGRNADMP